jgi:predicted amidohydrolase YtcJ
LSVFSRISQKLVGLAILVVLLAKSGRPAQDDPKIHDGEADLVLLEGKVITVDRNDSIAEAIAVKGGRIIAVGHTNEISKLIGKQTQVVQLGGRTVLPGFVDAHTHIEGIAAFHRMLDVHVPPLKGIDDILDKVRDKVRSTNPGEWIVGAGGWGQVLPTRQQLDAAAPANPVVLRESAHVQILNSKALQILGIDRNTVPPRGGNISHDPKTGELTGRIQEMPGVWLSRIPLPSYQAREQSLREVMQDFIQKGVTSIYDFPSADGMRSYQNLRDEGRLPLRLRCQIILTGTDPAFQQFVINYGPRTGFGDDWLRLGGIKLFVDGETESGVRYEPPGQREKWVGDVRYTQEELNDIVLRAHMAGFQVWTHALGDKAQDMILEAYERAQVAAPRPDPRHRIEHAGNNEAGPTTVEQLERMKRLGVIPVPTGAWIYLGHAAFKTQAKVPFIYRTMLDHGLRPPGTSDSLGSMPESTNPFFSMWTMVTRNTRDGELNGAEEAITVKEAIRGYTIDGAYSGFEEKNKGSIERGKLADLIVVSADPLTIESDQIKDIRVLMTLIDGKIVWRGGM